MFSRLPSLVLAMGAIVLFSGCSDPLPPEAGFDNCHADEGIEVCIAADRYPAGAHVAFTVTNDTNRELFLDGCSGDVEGRRAPGERWSRSFGYSRSCSAEPGSAEVRAAMKILPRGHPVPDTLLTNEQAYSGEWRLAVWILTADGLPWRIEPFVSPVFSLD